MKTMNSRVGSTGQRRLSPWFRGLLIVVLSALAFPGCALQRTSTVKYTDEQSGITFEVLDEPDVRLNGYTAYWRFTYESPEDMQAAVDPTHLIQWIEFRNDWTGHGVEAWRLGCGAAVDRHRIYYADTHYIRCVIAPGAVVDADENSNGFSMLPSDWPGIINKSHLEDHEIQGRVAQRLPEHEFRYRTEYREGKLRLFIEGSGLYWEWAYDESKPPEYE